MTTFGFAACANTTRRLACHFMFLLTPSRSSRAFVSNAVRNCAAWFLEFSYKCSRYVSFAPLTAWSSSSNWSGKTITILVWDIIKLGDVKRVNLLTIKYIQTLKCGITLGLVMYYSIIKRLIELAIYIQMFRCDAYLFGCKKYHWKIQRRSLHEGVREWNTLKLYSNFKKMSLRPVLLDLIKIMRLLVK